MVLPHQLQHHIPLLSPILAHRAYASANERESTGGLLASDHDYEALRAAATLARPPRNGLGGHLRGALRRCRDGCYGAEGPDTHLRWVPACQPPKPVLAAPRLKHGHSAVRQQDRKKAASLLQHSCGLASLNNNGALVTPFFLLPWAIHPIRNAPKFYSRKTASAVIPNLQFPCELLSASSYSPQPRHEFSQAPVLQLSASPEPNQLSFGLNFDYLTQGLTHTGLNTEQTRPCSLK